MLRILGLVKKVPEAIVEFLLNKYVKQCVMIHILAYV